MIVDVVQWGVRSRCPFTPASLVVRRNRIRWSVFLGSPNLRRFILEFLDDSILSFTESLDLESILCYSIRDLHSNFDS